MPKARQGNLVRKLFAAFGMSFAEVGHTICRSACFVGKVAWPFVPLRKPLAVRFTAMALGQRKFFCILSVTKEMPQPSRGTPATQIVRLASLAPKKNKAAFFYA